MLQTILAISGKPGLYKLVSRGNRMFIVESLDEKKTRVPAYGNDKIISLADISMYTEEGEVPLRQVFNSVKAQTGGEKVTLNPKKASGAELADFFAKVLPEYDRDRVYAGDIKKLITWFNILIENGITNFDEELKETEGDHIDDRQ